MGIASIAASLGLFFILCPGNFYYSIIYKGLKYSIVCLHLIARLHSHLKLDRLLFPLNYNVL